MWFEILPPAAIICVALYIPGFATYHLNKALCGNHYRRNTDERFDRIMYMRDYRLNKNVYEGRGLETITDQK
ncbi:hypothetical protein PVAND_007110 [Polypedilum vanderplanki]|uniref:NADH dehydrogenase [ubiquinone] 1 alpha subcomplex subunit 1 n=1 Tax=Polypedilum vanderplanki TaxID=319348 RepID=A0A9J6C5E2_POLVA|nr:hypothetical protein PVAND_007110 [Polypedilum vanderplanki]